MRTLGPIFLVGIAVALFVAYIDPTYQAVKELQAQAGQYDEALTQSTKLRKERDELLSKRNTFSTDNVRKLERLLPDNVDNIRLIIDIDNIASRYGLQVRNVALGDTTSSSRNQTVGQGQGAVGNVELGFSVGATYERFLAFLTDLEKSLRIVDVESIKLTPGTGDLDTYTLQIKTYWLR